MEDASILNDIKKAIPITVEDTSFDDILIFHTNHALALIIEKGYGPVEGFTINGAETKWSEFTDRNDALPFIKNYLLIMHKYKYKNSEIAAIGDQLMTDIYGANNIKIISILVDQISEVEERKTKFNRFLEKIILGYFKAKGLFNKGNYYE